MDTHAAPTAHEPEADAAWPPLPGSLWALAWSFVVGQVLALARFGTTDDGDWPVSALLGIAVVAFFAHGVVRARLVRFWIVVVLLVVAAVVELVAVVQEPGVWVTALLVLTALQLYLLNAYADSDWFRRHRTTRGARPPARGVLALACVVGLLAGVIGNDASMISVEVHSSF